MKKQNTNWKTLMLGAILTIITFGASASTFAQDSGYNSPAQQQIRRDMVSNAIRRQAGGGRRTSRRHSSHSSHRHHRRRR